MLICYDKVKVDAEYMSCLEMVAAELACLLMVVEVLVEVGVVLAICWLISLAHLPPKLFLL